VNYDLWLFLFSQFYCVQVTLVGRVCNKSGQITEFKFVLDDGTGTIECTKW
jgi:hypothetical protein